MPHPYILLFRNTGPENYAALSPEERQAIVERWNAWYQDLLDRGKAFEGQPLEDETRVVRGKMGQTVTDGPFSESKEAIGGYVKVRVADLAEATAIAQAHPALEHGLVIEIRQLTMDCHLGVSAHH
jgi:hypothetical protein